MESSLTCPIASHLRVDALDLVLEAELTLTYSTKDPLAVTLTFPRSEAEQAPTVWVLSRDLLASGLRAQVGEGDVVIRPRGCHTVLVTLTSPGGRVRGELERAPIEAFIRETYALLPASEESAALDLDGLIAALIAAP
ncbi:SsgA family sporulation/cell division regulator [Streptomyces sp. NBC_01283]|uniref:SsgA family sporulation/cell division regulator n=1 Tax=Streptomyces sp. NBC_01283 TaxID=2903812 RepID=UPI00352D560B|nr:SsgA family sporulation/cell division regulator [Streptomyces sp. NBC_01283]